MSVVCGVADQRPRPLPFDLRRLMRPFFGLILLGSLAGSGANAGPGDEAWLIHWVSHLSEAILHSIRAQRLNLKRHGPALGG